MIVYVVVVEDEVCGCYEDERDAVLECRKRGHSYYTERELRPPSDGVRADDARRAVQQ